MSDKAQFIISGVLCAIIAALAFVASHAQRELGRLEVREEAAQERVRNMKEAQKRNDEIEALPDGYLLDRVGRWIVP